VPLELPSGFQIALSTSDRLPPQSYLQGEEMRRRMPAALQVLHHLTVEGRPGTPVPGCKLAREAFMNQRKAMPLFILLLSALLSVSPVASGQTAERPATLGGIPVVVLSGTHYERGVVHGKTLGKQIIDVVDNYLAPQTNPILFFMTIKGMRDLLRVDPGIEEEAKGVVAGAKEALGGRFRSRYMSDDFTWQDIVGFSTYVDYVGTNCSSVSAWGGATADSGLNGQAVLVRNLDWSNDPVLLRNQVLFVHLPAEAGEQPFLSVGFAGFLGCLSCINQQRLGAFLNLGYGSRTGKFPPDEAYTPSALAFRHAVEVKRDVGSGGSGSPVKALLGGIQGRPGKVDQAPETLLDGFVTDMAGRSSVGSYIIHVVAPPSATKQDPALVLELAASKHAVRHAADDPQLGGEVLVATNHHRKLGKPSSCRRYQSAVDELGGSDKTTDPEALLGVLGKMRRPDTMETMLFIPATGEFRLGTKTKEGGEVGIPEKTSLEVLFGK
jgi:hypothetical protein